MAYQLAGEKISTPRLDLLPLAPAQLRRLLEQHEALEGELGFPVSRAMLTEVARRAIRMKLVKLEGRSEPDWPWFTYWLLVVRAQPLGAGLAGFKGLPDAQSQVEIGYGIDPAFGSQGYMTEAVRALIAWAFQHPACRAVIAPNTKKWNLASQRVLQKAGMTVYEETEDALNFRVERTEG